MNGKARSQLSQETREKLSDWVQEAPLGIEPFPAGREL